MASTTPLRQTDVQPAEPQSPIAIDPEVILAARADRIASGGASDAVRRSPERQGYAPASGAPPALDTTFRASHADAMPDKSERSSFGRWVLRIVATLLFAIISAVAAASWQNYGDHWQELVARWTPRISLSSTKSDNPAAPVTASTSPAPAPSPDSAPAVVASDSTELLQSMSRDLAALGQQVGDLKAARGAAQGQPGPDRA